MGRRQNFSDLRLWMFCEGCSRVKRAALPAFWVVWVVRVRAADGRVRGGTGVPGVIVARLSALAISARGQGLQFGGQFPEPAGAG